MTRRIPATSYIHGTLNAYTNHACRCTRCTETMTTYLAGWRARTDPADTPHGTRNGYVNYGCKCGPCKVADRDYMRDYMRIRRARERAK